jgi:uncharacterized protein YaiL (DUF2058 family)
MIIRLINHARGVFRVKSLQDQLLGAGLVDKKALKKANKDKHKQQMVAQNSKQFAVSDAKEQAELKRQEKLGKDRALNQQRNQAAEKKAVSAQIKQLIEVNSLEYRGDVDYNFADGKKIKKLAVTADVQRQLSRGRLAIVKLGDSYRLVVSEVAEKIAQRNDSYIVLLNTKEAEVIEEDDPYADFQIPDDLMW